MRTEPLILSLLIFSAVILAAGGFFGPMGAEYNSTVTKADITNQSVHTESLQEDVNETKSQTASMKSTPSSFGFIIFQLPYKVGKTILNAASNTYEATQSIQEIRYVPTWVNALLITGVSVVIVFAILRLVWSKEP